MRRSRSLWTARLAAVVLCQLGAGEAWAQPSGMIQEAEESESPEPAPPARAEHATIVLVGRAGQDRSLRDLIQELLSSRQIETRFVQKHRFRPSEVLADQAGDRSVRVYVELRRQCCALLYFRGPGGRRFLVRELALDGGLDALGREAVAQVIESSVLALHRTSAGLNRAEAQAEIARIATPEPQPESRAAASVPPAPARAEPAPSPAPPPSRSGVRITAAARYSADYSGSALGIGHGPGLELGVRSRGARVYGLRLAADRWFSRHLDRPLLDARIQTSQLRLLGEFGQSVGRQYAVVLAAGGGVTIVRADTTAAAANVTPSPDRFNALPEFAAEIRFEIRFTDWHAAVGLAGSLPLTNVHYDVETDAGATTRLAEPWDVRPGALLALGWGP